MGGSPRSIRRQLTMPGLLVMFDAWWWSQYVPDGEDDGGTTIDASGWSVEQLGQALG